VKALIFGEFLCVVSIYWKIVNLLLTSINNLPRCSKVFPGVWGFGLDPEGSKFLSLMCLLNGSGIFLSSYSAS